MGQYYRACLLEKDWRKRPAANPVYASTSPYFYGTETAKLTEHAYVGSEYVASAIRMLIGNKTRQFVWCGDYADAPEGFGKNMYKNATMVDEDLKYSKANGRIPVSEIKSQPRCILDHTKKEYAVVPEMPEGKVLIHPLPLLTADGNGQGGGDYFGPDMEKVGIWAYDIIEMSDKIPDGYALLETNFERIY